ncbi:Endonuclease MutS2 [Thermoflexales bacterium]|nr:Endonuclease MutS2 [Thermoflexales bacterium]
MLEAHHWNTLELPKVLAKLARYTAFSASTELALALEPSTFVEVVQQRLAETREARSLLTTRGDLSVGGVHDVRSLAENALRGARLLVPDLLAIRNTLIAARDLRRSLIKLESQYPRLASVAQRLYESTGIVNEIGRCVDESNGEVRDEATPELADARRSLREVLSRVQEKLRRIVGNSRNALYLQEAIITQRGGRYVIPIKADFKGRIQGIVHDQSASGATLFIEPLSTVELNNQLRELQLKEQHEIERVLLMLSNLVAADAQPISYTVEALAEIDVIFAKAKYADDSDAIEPAIENGPRATLRLIQARHPLLDPATVVPIDIDPDPHTHIIVLTGPNTGGKTVTLKTAGLLALMTQCGLHIPCSAGSALSIFEDIYADIGDEQSIEQSLSTFSSHLVNITGFIDRVGPKSLVLFDELGAGTDPAEGSALARSILDHVKGTKAMTLVATHYPELKVWAHTTAGATNASVEFDPETLRPTYKLTIGLPGRSNAFAIATRLGLKHDIVAHAKSMVAEGDLKVEDLLMEIHQQKEAVTQSREIADRARRESETTARQLRERLHKIEDERADILEAARQDAQAQVELLREEIDRLRKKLSDVHQPEVAAATAEVVAELEQLEEQAEAIVPVPVPIEKPVIGPRRKPRVGDTVFVEKVSSLGDITGIDRGLLEIAIGSLRMKVKPDEVEWRSSPKPAGETPDVRPSPSVHLTSQARLEIDLRGLRVDDGLVELERQLDAAYLNGMSFVRIIHGKGTGAMKKAVREVLHTNPQVKRFEGGKDEEGGEGVTIAFMRTDT